MPRRLASAQYIAHRSDEQVHRRTRGGAGLAALTRCADYTFAHAGLQVRLGPVAFWTVVGTLVIMAAWSITTATYFAFRDDVLSQLIARQAKMQFGYEDRIADLRAQIDRISSRQLLDQRQYEQKLDDIFRRQQRLEAHASALNSIHDATGTTRTHRSAPSRAGASRKGAHRQVGSLLEGPKPGIGATLKRLESSLDHIEARQSAALNLIERHYEARARRIRNVFAGLGINVRRYLPKQGKDIGGPLVLASVLPGTGDDFDRRVQRVNIARLKADALTRTLAAVPLRMPLSGPREISSGFGVRIDPFVGSPAMHTGDDFRGERGEPVHATANGKVTVAGWSGGYGRMVEIDHGNGLATRYGHLSAILVKVGETTKVGQVIGRIGSTGRSTGPHLHYETRVAGEAVDPQKFLRAGRKLELGQ